MKKLIIDTFDLKTILTLATIIVSITLAYGSLSTEIEVLKVKVNEIKDNHLYHIEGSMSKIEDRVHELEINRMLCPVCQEDR